MAKKTKAQALADTAVAQIAGADSAKAKPAKKAAKVKAAAKPKAKAKASKAGTTKASIALKMLTAKGGTTRAAIVAATGWGIDIRQFCERKGLKWKKDDEGVIRATPKA